MCYPLPQKNYKRFQTNQTTNQSHTVHTTGIHYLKTENVKHLSVRCEKPHQILL